MSTALPISEHTDICKTLTCLPDKFVVDFANGIDVARDHWRLQRQRTGFFARLYDGFTGTAARRQAAVNASLIDSVEGSLRWLSELTESLAKSNLAISRVNTRVNQIKFDLAQVANYSADTRRQLEELAQRLDERCSAL